MDRRGHRPRVAERVLEHAVAVAPERVLDGHRDGGAGRNGSFHEGVHVGDDEVDGDRCAPERLRRLDSVVEHLVDEQHRRAVDRHAGMHQLSVRAGEADHLGGPESFDVEVDGVGGAGADEVWRQLVHALREPHGIRIVVIHGQSPGCCADCCAGWWWSSSRPSTSSRYRRRWAMLSVTSVGSSAALLSTNAPWSTACVWRAKPSASTSGGWPAAASASSKSRSSVRAWPKMLAAHASRTSGLVAN